MNPEPKRRFKHVRRICLAAGFALAAILLEHLGAFQLWNDRLQDLRARFAPEEVSGEVVLVAIDATSIEAIGTWPWSRQVHADLLDHLTDAGARDVFFDVDFAFAADPAGDAAFTDALARSGAAFLAIFQQAARADGSGRVTNIPYAPFAAESWLALVNVFSDRQGLVRFYPYGTWIEEEYVLSAAAWLSGAYREDDGSFPINYAIRPDAIPIISASDLLAGRFDPTLFAGRSVIVGGTAIELGDLLSVPVHGIIPGPLVHALAAETLISGRIPAKLEPIWVMGGLFVLLLGLQSRLLQRPMVMVSAAGSVLLVAEAASYIVFASHAIKVPTAALAPSLLTFTGLALLRRLARNAQVIRQQRQQVENTSKLLSQVFDDSFDAIVILDHTGKVERQSEAAVALFGLDETGALKLPERLRQDAVQAMAGATSGALKEYEALGAEIPLYLEYTVTPSEAQTLHRRTTQTRRIATLSIRDVTENKQQAREIAYLSSYDDLTGALLRSAFLEFLDLRAMSGEPFAVYVFNLSRFKTINVVIGREIGDALLKQVVVRLQEAGLQISAPARLGGDTFACFTEFKADMETATEFATRLQALLVAPYALDKAAARVGARLGYTVVAPEDGLTPAEVLAQAEEALDAARLAGGEVALPYDSARARQQFLSRQIERALTRALENEEFVVWCQPQHRLSDLKLIGSEALVRWRSESLGQVFPDEFIEIAESTGFINDLGLFVLEKALIDTMKCPGDLGVAVNVSGIQMMSDSIVGDVCDVLRATGFPPAKLCLELTETVLFDGTGDLVEKMRDLQFRGITWALDDFGTGYSSMGYLSSLPIDKLKVDKSFAQGIGVDPVAEPILLAVSDLCRGLGMTLLCEGVETEAHLAFLQQHECAEAQGYFFGKPMPGPAFVAYAEECLRGAAPARDTG